MKEYIQLEENNLLYVVIKDKDGKETNCELEFDMEDIEMPLKASKMEYEHRKNAEWIKNQFIIIDKKPDKKDGLLTYKDRLKIEALKEFYEKEMKAIDLLLGEGKTAEILKVMRRKPYYSMFEDINKLLNPILPKLEKTTDDIVNKIKEKYSKKEDNVLE